MINVSIVMTVHNRRKNTLECLSKIYASQIGDIKISCTVLDDGSDDGTYDDVKRKYPQVDILKSDGSAFWNGGMLQAWRYASKNDSDFYLWLNDDTMIDNSCIEKMIRTSAFFADRAIVVGTTRDEKTNQFTYGGVRRVNGIRPLKFSLVEPGNVPIRVDTMNGNCVLVPRYVFRKIGFLSDIYVHGMGDFDYGLRAGKTGIEIWLVPGTIGTCSRNQITGTWQDSSLARRVRLRKLLSIKGLPLRSWYHFTHRHGGIFWGAYFILPYLQTIIKPKSTPKFNKRVVILYKYIPQYRRRFFELLRQNLIEKDIKMDLIYGQPGLEDEKKNDAVDLQWGKKRENKFIKIGNKALYWQPVLRDVAGADLVIAEQASRLLVNYVILLYSLSSKGRFAFWGHGKNFQSHNQSVFGERIKKFVSLHVHWWFAYNETSGKVIRDLGFSPSRITLVQNAIDTTALTAPYQKISQKEIEDLKTDLGVHGENVAIYTGSMYSDKRLEFLLESCLIIREKMDDFNIVFIGSGVDSELVEKAAQEHEWIHYLGVKFDEEKIGYFAMSKVFLMPGLVGLAILDSFALETPMITTALNFHSPEIEYLTNGYNGIIVENSDSIHDYADAVIDVMKDVNLHRKLVKGCVESQRLYSVEKMAEFFADGIVKALK